MNEMNQNKIQISEEDKLFSEDILDTDLEEDDLPEPEEEDPAQASLLPDGTFRQRQKALDAGHLLPPRTQGDRCGSGYAVQRFLFGKLQDLYQQPQYH